MKIDVADISLHINETVTTVELDKIEAELRAAALISIPARSARSPKA